MILLKTTICVIRHGETDWNFQKRCQGREDIDLNENGRLQAFELAKVLKRMNWDVILTSPLKRAEATAQIIGEELRIKSVIKEEKFIERDFGKASGLTFAQWEKAFPDGVVPDKENDEDLKNRVYQGLFEVVKEFDGKNIILISHGAVINSLLKTISEGLIDIGETNIKNACVNLILYNENVFSIKLHNSSELPA